VSFNVIVGTPVWYLSGVNVFAANLVRGLLEKGVPARLLITQPDRAIAYPLPLPADIPVETFLAAACPDVPARWGAMIRYLEGKKPCVYVPNHDYLYTCLSPKLPDEVMIVGHIHGPVDNQYEHFQALGRYWNATVAANRAILQEAAALRPALAGRLTAIPYSAAFPAGYAGRPAVPGAPLKVIYAGRLDQRTKRVRDLPAIVRALVARQVPVQLTITGSGEEEPYLRAACGDLVGRGVVRFRGTLPDGEYAEAIRESDIFLLTSQLDGMPLALIEAMGHGCVPVVTDIPGGLAEVVHDGANGFRVPVGDVEAFAERLALLQRDPARRGALSRQAFATVDRGGFRHADMAQRYLDLFRQAGREVASGAYRRPRGGPVLWSGAREHVAMASLSWKDALPAPMRALASGCERHLRRVLPESWKRWLAGPVRAVGGFYARARRRPRPAAGRRAGARDGREPS
jgi:glycosyltransferase involved in cell wall biosynthesis